MGAQLTFAKNFEYNYTPNQTELLKDSALAHPLRGWAKQFDRCAFKKTNNQKPPPSFYAIKDYQVRTIPAFLKSTPEKVKEVIEQIMADPPEEDHTVNICLKEQELTQYWRAFIVQTERQRLAQTSAVIRKILPP